MSKFGKGLGIAGGKESEERECGIKDLQKVESELIKSESSAVAAAIYIRDQTSVRRRTLSGPSPRALMNISQVRV